MIVRLLFVMALACSLSLFFFFLFRSAEKEYEVIGTCTGCQYLKDQPDPPMYEDAYYPDWLFKMAWKKRALTEMDPDSPEFENYVNYLRIRAKNFQAKNNRLLKNVRKPGQR